MIQCECFKTGDYWQEPCRHPAKFLVSNIPAGDGQFKSKRVCQYCVRPFSRVESYAVTRLTKETEPHG